MMPILKMIRATPRETFSLKMCNPTVASLLHTFFPSLAGIFLAVDFFLSLLHCFILVIPFPHRLHLAVAAHDPLLTSISPFTDSRIGIFFCSPVYRMVHGWPRGL
ncbi:unnamed protein product [Sphacelaria rigidula]